MPKHILFLHGGGGEEDFTADKKLVESLKLHLDDQFILHYPMLIDDGTPDFGRCKQIDSGLAAINDKVIMVAHSLGASMLLKYLSETKPKWSIAGIFLIATPFWSGEEDWVQPLKLRENLVVTLTENFPIHFYHCIDDEEVPFEHFNKFRSMLSQANFHKLENGGPN